MGFSPIIHLFEESGEEYFENDFTRDIQKDLRPGFRNEVMRLDPAKVNRVDIN